MKKDNLKESEFVVLSKSCDFSDMGGCDKTTFACCVELCPVVKKAANLEEIKRVISES